MSGEPLRINAWIGAAAEAPLADTAGRWAVRRQLQEYPQTLAADEPADPRDWRHRDVGWGLVLPDDDTVTVPDRAAAADAPPSIRTLLAARPGSPVFRYRRDALPGFLRRYYADGRAADISLAGSPRGLGDHKLPWYMLIAASPADVPWQVQYLMNVTCYTGRLDLDEAARARYVDALINDWPGAAATAARPVVWAVDLGSPDITWLMRGTIADPVAQLLGGDAQIDGGLTHLAGAAATSPALMAALAANQPALIVTTSHGLTSPLDDTAAMRAQLGLPVDRLGAALTPEAVLAAWQPEGAIWYAHACCSAGSDAGTSYKGLVTAGSDVERVLEAVGALGAATAPLPRALLSAARPARAFVGQVEPTFDYTLRRPENRQVLTASLQKALYNRMFRKQPEPVGLALANCYRHVGELFAEWQQLVREVGRATPGAREQALRAQLMAIDRQSMVILGDPTVALPPLA